MDLDSQDLETTHLHAKTEHVRLQHDELIAGKYKIISTLGSGGMGTVYEVNHEMLNERFALKLLDVTKLSNPTHVKRFQLEAKAAVSLSHPNLVKVHEFGITEGGQPYLVMDFLEGETLAQRVERKGVLKIGDAISIFERICSALSYAHDRSVIHRDIKSANIMLIPQAFGEHSDDVRVLDFGIAKMIGNDTFEGQSLTQTGEIFGSPLYMSPEQCAGEKVDKRSDIYSLGCTLFEALTGTTPYVGANALKTMMLHQAGEVPKLREAALGASFPEGLETVVAKMLEKDPDNRYSDLQAVARDLKNAASGGVIVIPKASVPAQTKMLMLKVAVVSLLVLTVGWVGFRLQKHPSSPTTAPPKAEPAPTKAELAPPEAELAPKKREPPSQKVQEPLNNLPSYDNVGILVDDSGDEANDNYNPSVITSQLKINRDGKKVRVFTFPPGGIGYIRVLTPDLDYGPEQRIMPALGRVMVPASGPVLLGIKSSNRRIINVSKETYDKIAPNAFAGLMLNGAARLPKEELKFKDELSPIYYKKIQDKINYSLNMITHWTNLRMLHLVECELDKVAIKDLSKLKTLEALIIDSCPISPENYKAFCSVSTLKTLNRARFLSFPASLATKALLPGKNITKVEFLECAVHASDVAVLQAMPNLSSLVVAQHNIDEPTLKAICELKQLTSIFIDADEFGASQMRMVLGCRNLEQIQFAKTKMNAYTAITPKDPRVDFIVDDRSARIQFHEPLESPSMLPAAKR